LSAARAIGVWTLAAAAVLGLAACDRKTSASERTATGRPTVLRYSYAPGVEEPQAQTIRLDGLKRYLSERLKMPVELYKSSAGYGMVIEAMRAQKVDVATMGPFGYLIASEKAGAQVIVVSGSKSLGAGDYRGTIAVARNSRLKTIDDLIAHSKELTFSFVDPASTSGFLVQRAYFQSIGLDPDKDFKKTMFSTNHVASAMTLMTGKVDAAAMMEIIPARLMKRNTLKEGDIRFLWMSPPLPSSPIIVRNGFSESFKRELQQALVELPDREPELWKTWPHSNTYTDPVLLPGNDAMFDGLRAIARNISNLSLLEQ
jgi:phosphonate transport system substrate-binding protein